MARLLKFGCDGCGSRAKGIFCDLDKVALQLIGENKQITTFKKGEILFTQGNEPTGVYCINSGKIKVSKIGHDGKESIVRIVSAGDVLGHRSLFSNENYGATATAIEETIVCFLNKRDFQNTIQQQPSVALNVIKKLSEAMGEAESKYAGISQKSVRVRLVELLLALNDDYGIKDGNRWKLNIKLTREEMAAIIGTTPETIIRCLTEFKNLELISQEGKVIYLEDIGELTLIKSSVK